MKSNLKTLASGLYAHQGAVYGAIAIYMLVVLSSQPLGHSLAPQQTLSVEEEWQGPSYRPVITIVDLPSPRSVELIREVEQLLGSKTKYPTFRNERMYGTAEIECLAKNIYFEARHESLLGQVAVGLVTVHRVNDKRFPSSICGVAQQGGEQTLHRCQFSWYCDGLSDNPKELDAYRFAQDVAAMVLDPATVLPDFTQGATHYHADYITTPCWATRMEKITHIDTHIFYRELPEYTPCVPKRSVDELQANAG